MKSFLIIICLFVVQFSFTQVEKSTELTKTWSLEECIKYALEKNVTVKDAALNMSLAEIEFEKSKSARLPNLFGSVSQNFSNGNAIDPITSYFVTDQIHSTNAGINTSVTLFKGGQMNNQIKQNKILLEQSLLLGEVEKNSIVLKILENYLQALYSKESITIAENNLSASEKEVLRAKALLDAGKFTQIEYSAAQSQVATNKYKLIAAKNEFQQFVIVLKQLIELSPTENFDVKSIGDDLNVNNLLVGKEEIYTNALGILPEIQASDLSIAASMKGLDIMKGAYLPTLSLVGSLGTGYTSINPTSFRDQFDFNFNQKIGVSLVVPIFNRYQTRAAVQTATINIEKAEIQKRLVEKSIYSKVETAYQNALSAQEQVVAAESSKLAAEQAYLLAQKMFELGGMATTDLVISQNTYTNAQENYLQAKYLAILYYQLLEFYQGNEIKL